jgi:hypothetical protein
VTLRPSAALALAFGALATLACRKHTAPVPPPSLSATEVSSAKPVDRLAPDELEPGKSQVFGFEVPRRMRVQGAFLEVAYVEGDVTPEALANYVRERVEVERVEIGAASTRFERARIKRGAAERIYDFEVSPGPANMTELVIRDVTPPPPNPSFMNETDRWRQAGRKPDGTPLDIRDFK